MLSSITDKLCNLSRIIPNKLVINLEKQCMLYHGNGGFYGNIILIMHIKTPKLLRNSFNFNKNSSYYSNNSCNSSNNNCSCSNNNRIN